VSVVVLDDHLLRDVLATEQTRSLARLVDGNEVATTNLYYVRLCRSVVAAGGGKLTGQWSAEGRKELGRRLLELPDSISIVPMRHIGFRVAELIDSQRVSTLGAEAIAAAEYLTASLCVWEGDDGPGIRQGALATGVPYRTLAL
jgi:hypothetical protein